MVSEPVKPAAEGNLLLLLFLLTKPRSVSVEINLCTVETGSAPHQRGPPVVGGLPLLPALPLSSLSFLLAPLPSLSVVPQQPCRGNDPA